MRDIPKGSYQPGESIDFTLHAEVGNYCHLSNGNVCMGPAKITASMESPNFWFSRMDAGFLPGIRFTNPQGRNLSSAGGICCHTNSNRLKSKGIPSA